VVSHELSQWSAGTGADRVVCKSVSEEVDGVRQVELTDLQGRSRMLSVPTQKGVALEESLQEALANTRWP
jgi:hypothetical protein